MARKKTDISLWQSGGCLLPSFVLTGLGDHHRPGTDCAVLTRFALIPVGNRICEWLSIYGEASWSRLGVIYFWLRGRSAVTN